MAEIDFLSSSGSRADASLSVSFHEIDILIITCKALFFTVRKVDLRAQVRRAVCFLDIESLAKPTNKTTVGLQLVCVWTPHLCTSTVVSMEITGGLDSRRLSMPTECI